MSQVAHFLVDINGVAILSNRFCWTDVDIRAHAAVGTIFPQPWLAGAVATRMDAVAGTGWRVVLARTADASLADAAASFAGVHVFSLGAPDFLEADGVLAGWFGQQGCVAAIVRPDHYVYGVASVAKELEAQLGALQHALYPVCNS